MKNHTTLTFHYLLFFIFILSYSVCNSQEINSNYAVAQFFTPVLNTSDFESVFGGPGGNVVKLDNKGLIREMEFVAFPNTVFQIFEIIPKEGYNIFKVKTEDYPYNNSDLFIDSRFVTTVDSVPDNRKKSMPSKNEIISTLNALEGFGYMWGGNLGIGVEQLLDFYKPKSELKKNIRDLWSLRGVDCSGLVYQATNGSTPRNTSSLINYGEGLDIAGMNSNQISEMLQPLDLIAWNGHVIIVIDNNTVIESTPQLGVHKSDLLSRLKSIMNERTPVNDWSSTIGKRFVVRRWI